MSLEKFIEKYNQIETGDSYGLIENFENNSTLLLNQSAFKIENLMNLYLDSLSAFFEKGQYKRLYIITSILEDKIKNELNIKNELIEDIKFYKCASAYNQKKYKIAIIGFKELMHLFPNNENFVDWYRDSKYKRRLNFYRWGQAIGLSIAFLTLAPRLYFDSFNSVIVKRIGNFGELLFIISFVLNLIDYQKNGK